MQQRKTNRLQGYDYSLPGAYFVTLVAKKRQPLFGRLVNDTVELSDIGRIIIEEWKRTGELRPEIALDEYVVMPDHFHAILFIHEGSHKEDPLGAHRGAPLRRAPGSLGQIIAGFKSVVSQRAGYPVWQRNYHDRIVRNQIELDQIREYIAYNPLKLWEGW